MNNESKESFLIAAINDISGNIKYLDTKITLIMATSGVLIGIVSSGVTSLSEILTEKELILSVILKSCFNTCAVLFGISAAAMFFCGIMTIKVRNGKSYKTSLWYLGDSCADCDDFEERVRKLTETMIVDNLALELFNLNTINSKKMFYTKLTVSIFSLSCIFAGFLLSVILWYKWLL